MGNHNEVKGFLHLQGIDGGDKKNSLTLESTASEAIHSSAVELSLCEVQIKQKPESGQGETRYL